MNIKINKPFNFAFPIYLILALYFGFQGYVSWYVILLLILHDVKLTFDKKNTLENINR
jgi:cytochrome c oxidase subunit IV